MRMRGKESLSCVSDTGEYSAAEYVDERERERERERVNSLAEVHG